MARGKATGRPRSALDTIVAAIAQSNGCIVVTDNERDFHGVEIINPLGTPEDKTTRSFMHLKGIGPESHFFYQTSRTDRPSGA